MEDNIEKEEKSLAYELLQEVKHTNKRLFIISLVELAIIVGMIIGFFIYESQFEYSSSSEMYQELEDSDLNNLNQIIGE